MGRTLMGIDLDESPFGGIIERLLDEEELEALDAVPDGGTDDVDTDSDAGFAGRNVSSDSDSDADRSSDSGVAETPSPGADDDSRDRILEEFADEDEDEEGEESADGRLAGIRSRLRPLMAALAVLTVLAVVAALVLWRYGDRIAAAVPGPFGGGDEGDDHSATDEFDSATGFGPDADTSDSAIGSDEDAAGGTGPSTSAAGAGEDEDEDEETVAATDSSDGDLGALVGLAFLAVVAVIVRKFAEERDHDPLVDGEQ